MTSGSQAGQRIVRIGRIDVHGERTFIAEEALSVMDCLPVSIVMIRMYEMWMKEMWRKRVESSAAGYHDASHLIYQALTSAITLTFTDGEQVGRH